MANKHHLEILRQSDADAWKAWRLAHALLLPDLYSADLSGADLTGANLMDANMRGATLNWAQLDDALITGEQLLCAYYALIFTLLPTLFFTRYMYSIVRSYRGNFLALQEKREA